MRGIEVDAITASYAEGVRDGKRAAEAECARLRKELAEFHRTCRCDAHDRIAARQAKGRYEGDTLRAWKEMGTVDLVEGSDGEWECSGCGAAWALETDTPEANGYIYCPRCGKQVKEYKHFDDGIEEERDEAETTMV